MNKYAWVKWFMGCEW